MKLWVARAIERLGPSAFADARGTRLDDTALALLGFPVGTPRRDDKVVTPGEQWQLLKQLVLDLSDAQPSRALQTSAARVARLFGLDAVEQSLIVLLARLHTCEALCTTIAANDVSTRGGIARTLAHVLACPPGHMKRALGEQGVLARSRLLKFEGGHLGRSIGVTLHEELLDVLLEGARTDAAVIARFAPRAPRPTLSLESHAHAGGLVPLAATLLEKALAQKLKGTNVLLYGPPGTGKTELARGLAAHVKAALYEVKTDDDDGDAINGFSRFCVYDRCQRLVSHLARSVVLFDEAEDVFPSAERALYGMGRKSPAHKGFTNKLLEQNPSPTLWITNEVDAIDPAYLRRFDLVIHVRTPPESVRRGMVRRAATKLGIGAGLIESLAANASMTPAVLGRAARVAELTSTVGAERERALQLVVAGFTEAQQGAQGGVRSDARRSAALDFDIDYVNATPSMDTVLVSLGREQRGSVLLVGPPGTGKTELAHHAARAAGVSLITKRASDLLGSFVGQTEKAIRHMFSEARDSHAYLLLDEADSFLRDRRHASRNWEVTQVNELLVQMESFDGVFFCATNLASDIDPAAFRRFDLKVQCAALTLEARLRIVKRTFAALDADVGQLEREVARLEGLCIGDVASVKRGAVLSPIATLDELVLRLRGELSLRKAPKRLGFS